jgi:hypothetical protein
MTVSLNVPDMLLPSLGTEPADISRAIAEGFAVEAYRSGTLSVAEIAEFLGLESRWAAEEFLSQHSAWPDPTESEIIADLDSIAASRLK